MGFKANFSSSDNSFAANFNNEAQEHSPNFGTYNTIYDGENGATFYPNVSEEGVLSWTNDRELPNPTPVKVRGEDGKDGIDGKDGVSVISVRQTTTSNADGGTNVITITLSNGNNYTFSVINGSKGSKGDTGAKGDKGDKGDTGADGKDGADYVLTDADKQEIATQVGAAETWTFTLASGETVTKEVLIK